MVHHHLKIYVMNAFATLKTPSFNLSYDTLEVTYVDWLARLVYNFRWHNETDVRHPVSFATPSCRTIVEQTIELLFKLPNYFILI